MAVAPPLQGALREHAAKACGDSTVAHFARKVRGTKVAAKHCSSLCSQSEGREYCGGQARAENLTKSCPGALVMFATCSWPSLCEQSELQCWRRNRRLCEPTQISAARALPPILFFFWILNTLPERGNPPQPRRERPERAACPQPRATPWVSAYKRLRPVRVKVWANG